MEAQCKQNQSPRSRFGRCLSKLRSAAQPFACGLKADDFWYNFSQARENTLTSAPPASQKSQFCRFLKTKCKRICGLPATVFEVIDWTRLFSAVIWCAIARSEKCTGRHRFAPPVRIADCSDKQNFGKTICIWGRLRLRSRIWLLCFLLILSKLLFNLNVIICFSIWHNFSATGFAIFRGNSIWLAGCTKTFENLHNFDNIIQRDKGCMNSKKALALASRLTVCIWCTASSLTYCRWSIYSRLSNFEKRTDRHVLHSPKAVEGTPRQRMILQHQYALGFQTFDPSCDRPVQLCARILKIRRQFFETERMLPSRQGKRKW